MEQADSSDIVGYLVLSVMVPVVGGIVGLYRKGKNLGAVLLVSSFTLPVFYLVFRNFYAYGEFGNRFLMESLYRGLIAASLTVAGVFLGILIVSKLVLKANRYSDLLWVCFFGPLGMIYVTRGPYSEDEVLKKVSTWFNFFYGFLVLAAVIIIPFLMMSGNLLFWL